MFKIFLFSKLFDVKYGWLRKCDDPMSQYKPTYVLCLAGMSRYENETQTDTHTHTHTHNTVKDTKHLVTQIFFGALHRINHTLIQTLTTNHTTLTSVRTPTHTHTHTHKHIHTHTHTHTHTLKHQ